MGMKLPFYGKRGSIAKIEECRNNYEVSTYDIDGNFNDFILNIKKNKKNENELFSLFYTEMDEYLRFNKDKYNDLVKKGVNSLVGLNKVKVILLFSVLIGVMPIGVGVILANSVLMNIGIIPFVVGAIGSTASIVILDKKKKHNDNVLFVRDYANMVYEYNIFIKNKEKERDIKLSRSLESTSRDLSNNKSFVKVKKVS